MSKVFVLGNGESRNGIDLESLRGKGKIYGCNALYRDFAPDGLVCVDGGMMHEVYESGYALKHKCYFRSWTKLPEFIYDDMSNLDTLMEWSSSSRVENDKGNRTQFVMNGTDPSQMQRLYEHHKQIGSDETTMKQLFSQHKQWITWVEDEDKVEVISDEYSGWSAGPTAVRVSIDAHDPTEVYLLGFDMTSADGKINNIYKGTDNYLSFDSAVTPHTNWVDQHMVNFDNFPSIKFYRVNTKGFNFKIKEWNIFYNFEDIDFEEFQKSIDE